MIRVFLIEFLVVFLIFPTISDLMPSLIAVSINIWKIFGLLVGITVEPFYYVTLFNENLRKTKFFSGFSGRKGFSM